MNLRPVPWQFGWVIDPKGLRYILNQYHGRYEVPLFIVENGFGYEDILEDGQIYDQNLTEGWIFNKENDSVLLRIHPLRCLHPV